MPDEIKTSEINILQVQKTFESLMHDIKWHERRGGLLPYDWDSYEHKHIVNLCKLLEIDYGTGKILLRDSKFRLNRNQKTAVQWIQLKHLNDKIKALKEEIENGDMSDFGTMRNHWEIIKELIDKHLLEGK